MRAVVLENGRVDFRADYHETPRANEIPVDVTLAGICETDLQLVRGYMDFQGVLGHEFAGVAREGKYAGQRVVGEINCSCGQCKYCQSGKRNHCPHRSVIGILNHDGAFADTVYVPEANLAAAFEIPAQLDLSRFAKAVVIGDGRLAYLIAQVLRLHQCDVTVVGKHAEKLEHFRNAGLLTRQHRESDPARDFPLAVDCTGSPTGVPTAMRYLQPRGTLVLKTTHAGEHGPKLAPIVIDEITLVGSRCGPFDVALRALEQGQIEVASMITARYPIEDAVSAIEAASQMDHRKVLLEIAP